MRGAEPRTRLSSTCRTIILQLFQTIKFVSWRPEFFASPQLSPHMLGDVKRETKTGLPACHLRWMTGMDYPITIVIV